MSLNDADTPREQGAAIIFGGTGSIGLAVGERLHSVGYEVHLAARHARRQIDGMMFHTCDVTESLQVRSIFAEVGCSGRPVTAVVHCAGANSRKLICELTDEIWNGELLVNLSSVFYCLREARAAMANGGSIVIVGSMMGDRASRNPGYAAAKAGLVGLVRAAAPQLAERHIRVNGVAPGYVASTMLKQHPQAALAERISSEIVLGRPAHSSEIAEVIEFLLSDRSSYIVGSMVPCTGGLLF